MKDIIFVNSHPIQYFAPMYKFMNENGVKTKAWYCSDFSIMGGFDIEFGQKIKWDIPLLEGYEYQFFKNFSSSRKSEFWRFVNWGMIRTLFKCPKSIIILHGYHYFTHFSIIMLGKILGHTICLRNDIPLSHELLKKGWKQKLKRFGLRYVVFPRINYFLFIGTQNKLYYESFQIDKNQLVSCPYAVDNERFRSLQYDKNEIKKSLGVPLNDRIITFSAKYIEKKRPLDLIQAFHKLNLDDCWLIMVGDGKLRKIMEEYISSNKMSKVILTGFVNQQEIPKFYAVSDLFVMCSSNGEHWGLSANEAMNFNLPLILSDLTGCSNDLVVSESNGYVFETGNVDELTSRIKDVLVLNKLTATVTSKELVDNFSYKIVLDNLVKLC
ncbi:glycosyltransferase family 4 protein [Flavobacterium urumqiense]|uniref:Glycosyltransferase involved in cell wall bisynthesis n=1 Tax=Flavobacterium urumqiense TaxID=935224 RepID=A0A1H5Y381_9FLAO|nr:glycosyltransferase family 4 protein [Flavobacterium urumqiense]SEG18519.1 Glycosyltransferase involved in cell wall bisynthesis [Flavobacterium urumqiense]